MSVENPINSVPGHSEAVQLAKRTGGTHALSEHSRQMVQYNGGSVMFIEIDTPDSDTPRLIPYITITTPSGSRGHSLERSVSVEFDGGIRMVDSGRKEETVITGFEFKDGDISRFEIPLVEAEEALQVAHKRARGIE